MPLSFLRHQEVQSRTGLSRSTLYQAVTDGTLTTPVSLGTRAVGWPDHEIDAILSARLAGASVEDLQALVAHLHEQRQAGAFTAGTAA